MPRDRVLVRVDSVCRDVHDPRLGNTGAGVKRNFDVAVIGQCGIGHLDDQQDICGARMPKVGIGPGFEQDHVRLGRVVFAEYHGVLYVHDGGPAEGPREQLVEAPDAARMAVADRTHLDDLSGNELDPVVLPQDPQLGQPLVGIHCERASEEVQRHRHNIGSARMPSQCGAGERLRRGAVSE